MTPLPERKKSSDEIAKLRESLGVPPTERSPDEATAEPKQLGELTQSQDGNLASNKLDAPAPPPAPPEKPQKAHSPNQKSEPLERLPSPPDSPLPHQRHSQEEIEAIRRQCAFSMVNTIPDRRMFPAHPALLALGYLPIPIAVAGIAFYNLPLWGTALCAASVAVVSILIFFRYPVSRHHAGFSIVLMIFLLVFASLHYFPQLRHAT